MSAFQVGDRVQILVGRHQGKSGVITALDSPNGGYWVRPDGTSIPALYENYELTLDLRSEGELALAEDDGTEAEALAEVSAPAFPDVLVHGRPQVGVA